jgi:diguanylate cyclase (GGDEF)-like protein/PAS domain S-box-containing protein
MSDLPQDILARIPKLSPEGIVVCKRGETDWPVIFANAAFERLTGYDVHELIGRDLRMLQGKDRDQESRQRIRSALAAGESCRVLMRNYRHGGTAFWNEMLLEPVKDDTGAVTHFIGYHRDASERLRLEPKPAGAAASRDSFGATSAQLSPLAALRDDRLTGLYTRDYFNELLRRDWAIAQRDERELSMMLFDVDCLGSYNDTFGQTAGDACIKRVARTIGACLRRGSDLAARLEGGTIVTLIHGMDIGMTLTFAHTLLERVREQHIHHPRSSVQRYLTVSGGVSSLKPSRTGEDSNVLLEKAQAALKEAKKAGRNCVLAG